MHSARWPMAAPPEVRFRRRGCFPMLVASMRRRTPARAAGGGSDGPGPEEANHAEQENPPETQAEHSHPGSAPCRDGCLRARKPFASGQGHRRTHPPRPAASVARRQRSGSAPGATRAATRHAWPRRQDHASPLGRIACAAPARQPAGSPRRGRAPYDVAHGRRKKNRGPVERPRTRGAGVACIRPRKRHGGRAGRRRAVVATVRVPACRRATGIRPAGGLPAVGPDLPAHGHTGPEWRLLSP